MPSPPAQSPPPPRADGPLPLSTVGTTAPAGQVFAAAITAWSRDAARSPQDQAPSAPPASAPPAPAPLAMPVPAPDGAQGTMPDARHDHAAQGMIDHIDQLRDAANAVDTRIRIVPDALGAIDVAVRKEGDTVHVHLAAEQAATRTMLNEAAPRLTEMAEQRGLKLGQTMVDAGTTGRDQPRQQPPAPASPAPRAPAPVVADAPAVPDQRIA
jgi:flagellar hook-length control protein FliK